MQAFQEMMTGKPGTTAAQKASAQTEAKPASNPYADALASMFDSGLEVQKAYQKSMESIFDTYLGGKPAGEAAAAAKSPK